MSIYIGIVFVIFNCIIYLKQPKAGLIFYIVGAYCVPLSLYGEAKISYEILGFLGIAAIWGVKTVYQKNFIYRRIYLFPIIYMFLYGFSTFISVIVHHCSVYWVSIFGCYRLLLLFIIFTQEDWSEKIWEYFLNLLVVVNSICAFVQIIYPQCFYAFAKLYVKNEKSMTILFEKTWGYHYARTFGLTSTPSIISYICIIVMVHYLCKFFQKKGNGKDCLFLTLSILSGISTATKAFYLGIIVCVAMLLFLSFFFYKKEHRKFIVWSKSKSMALIGMALIIVGASSYMDAKGIMVSDYIKKSLHIVTALETRYNLDFVKIPQNEELNVDNEAESNGEKKQTQDLPVQAPQTAMYQVEALQSYESLIGVGATTPYGEAIQDSEWFMMIHNAGILGLITMIAWVGCLIRKSYRNSNIELLIYEIMLLILGLAIGSIVSLTGIVLITYIFNENKKDVKMSQNCIAI